MSDVTAFPLEHRVAALESAVTALQSEQRARELLYAYAACCDRNDVIGVAALFEESAVLTVPAGPVTGRPAIETWYRERLLLETKHHVANTVVTERHADGLSMRSEFVALVWSARGTATSVQWGSYLDRVRLDGPAATFAARTIELHGSGEIVPSGTTARLGGASA